MMTHFPLQQWESDNLNQPTICRRCGGLGTVRRRLRRPEKECPACRGTGGAIDDESAWWRVGQR